jgi:hypothetical protein
VRVVEAALPEDDPGELQYEAVFSSVGLALVFVAREDDPGVMHAFAPNREAGVLRGMTSDESILVASLEANETIDRLSEAAVAAWSSWADVENLVIVHNVVDPPEREVGEA